MQQQTILSTASIQLRVHWRYLNQGTVTVRVVKSLMPGGRRSITGPGQVKSSPASFSWSGSGGLGGE